MAETPAPLRRLGPTEKAWLGLYRLQQGCGLITHTLLFRSQRHLTPQLVHQALQQVQRDVAILGCRIVEQGSTPYFAPMATPTVTLTACPRGRSWEEEHLQQSNMVSSLDMNHGPMWRASFVPCTAEGQYALTLSLGHWVSDGMSNCYIFHRFLVCLQQLLDLEKRAPALNVDSPSATVLANVVDGTATDGSHESTSNGMEVTKYPSSSELNNPSLNPKSKTETISSEVTTSQTNTTKTLPASYEELCSPLTGLLQQLGLIPRLLKNLACLIWLSHRIPDPKPLLNHLIKENEIHQKTKMSFVQCHLSAAIVAPLAAECRNRGLTMHSVLLASLAAASHDVVKQKMSQHSSQELNILENGEKSTTAEDSRAHQAVSKAVKGEKRSVNGQSAMAKELPKEIQGDMTVNARRYLKSSSSRCEPVVASAALMSQLVPVAAGDSPEELWVAAEATAARTTDLLSRQVPLDMMRVAGLLLGTLHCSMQFIHNRMRDTAEQPSASEFLVNNVGRMDDIVTGTADLQPVELHLLNRVTPLSSRCAGHHVFHTLAGTMTYDLCYIQGQMLTEDAEMFADAVVKRLKSLVGIDV